MKKTKLILRLEHEVVLLGLFLFAIWCLKNWNFFIVPNIDIYQYLCDARAYYSGRFPNYVQPQPLYSLLIFPLSIIFYHQRLPEFQAGIFISMISCVGGLYITWLFSKKYLRLLWRMILMILLFSHPLFLYASVNTTPDALLFFCVILSMYVYSRKKNGGYFFAILSASVKFEGYVVLAMMTLTDLLVYYQQKKSFKINKKQLLTFLKSYFLPIIMFISLIVWHVVTVSYNFKQIRFANFFVKELVQTKQALPDLRKTGRIFDLIESNVGIFNTNLTNIDMFEVMIVVTLFGILAVKSYQQKKWPLFISVGFCAGYLLIHSFFPAYNPRYFFPILALLFLYICIFFQFIANSSKTSRWIYVMVTVLLTSGWIFDLWHYKYEKFMIQDKYNQSEERYVAEWLNEFQKQQTGQYNIIGPVERVNGYMDGSAVNDPFSKGIFNRPKCEGTPFTIETANSSLTVFNSSFPEFAHCKDALCLVKTLPESNNKVIVMDTGDSSFEVTPENCFKKITTLPSQGGGDSHTVVIYEFLDQSCK